MRSESSSLSKNKGEQLWFFPTETQILQLVHGNRRMNNNLMCSLDIRGEYICHLLKSLLKRGFIKRHWLGGYCLTDKGLRRVSG